MSVPSEWLQLAVEHHQAGRLPQAEQLYRQILQGDPNNPDALSYLGLMAQQLGQHDYAVELIEKAHRYGRAQPHSLNALGMAHAGAGRFREAKKFFSKALGMKADYADAHANLGSTLRALGHPKEAETSYRRSLALKPQSAQAHFNLASLLLESSRPREAEEAFRRALGLQPAYVEAHNNLGSALAALGRTDEAEASYRSALASKPNYIQAHHNLANLLRDTGRTEEAERSYRAALAIDPRLYETRTSLGNLLHRLDRFDEAAACFREASAIRPDAAAAHYNLGNSLASLGQWHEAAASYKQAIALDPNFAAARWALAMVQLPAVYENEPQLAERRAAFGVELARLGDWLQANPKVDGESAFVQQPFHLAYQEENNRDLLARYGALCDTVMRRWQTRQRPASIPRTKGGAVRVGIASAHVHAHSVWDAIVKGWLEQLDRSRIELYVFHLGHKTDEQTQSARGRAAHFTQGAGGLREWVDAIRGEQLDALIFPEIAMHTLTAQLASLRLAPMQLASWGHPETTGLPTIDFYLSADAFEPDAADQNYSEKLVRLPNLGCWYEPYSVTPEPPDLDLASDTPLLLCCGTPFKYGPSYDRLLVAIARELGVCRFLFFEDKALAPLAKLRRRLEGSFRAAGLDYERFVLFAPWQPRPQFYGLMQRANLLLDTVGFSGFNTTMQAVQCALPVVAWEGRFMRGRFASAVLKRIQLEELVATSESSYVEKAVKLARNAQYRGRIAARIEASREILYRDRAPVAALEEFLARSGTRSSS